MDWHTDGILLINGTLPCKGNHLQSLIIMSRKQQIITSLSAKFLEGKKT